jgi:hypothetical protein
MEVRHEDVTDSRWESLRHADQQCHANKVAATARSPRRGRTIGDIALVKSERATIGRYLLEDAL